jgi:hypothetical protein
MTKIKTGHLRTKEEADDDQGEIRMKEQADPAMGLTPAS